MIIIYTNENLEIYFQNFDEKAANCSCLTRNLIICASKQSSIFVFFENSQVEQLDLVISLMIFNDRD